MENEEEIMGNTYFINSTTSQSLGDLEGILPVTLYKGMKITIHGHSQLFFVENWHYHHGHPDEQAGLKIYLKSMD